jgi:hypothetical protein
MSHAFNDKINDLNQRKHHIDSLKAYIKKRKNTLSNEITLLENQVDICLQSNALLDKISEEEIEQGIKTYVSLLEQGLKAIFPEQKVGLSAQVEKVRGKISLRLKTTFEGEDGIIVEGEGIDSFGGAVSTVQSLLLRISLILKRKLRPILVLDESFPAIDEERVVLLINFLKVLCEKLGMEILCITHNNLICENATLSYKIYPSKEGAKLKKI